MSLCKFLELDLIALRQKGFKKWCRSFFFIIFALFNPIVCVILFFYYSLFVILSHPHVFFSPFSYYFSSFYPIACLFSLFLILFRHFILSHVFFPLFLIILFRHIIPSQVLFLFLNFLFCHFILSQVLILFLIIPFSSSCWLRA